MFSFHVLHSSRHSRARSGRFETPHGVLHTPELAIVGTEAAFKCLPPDDIPPTSIQYAIANTFHIWVKNILPGIEETGGIHHYMNYPRVLATDSGGFQVFSLGFGTTHGTNKLGAIFPGNNPLPADADTPPPDENNPVQITEEGATFLFDSKEWHLTPELSMDLQHRIGADIMFAFDECTSSLNTKEYTEQSLERTHRWLDRCITAHQTHREKQALFAIVQGGAYRDLRERSARFMAEQDVPGYGIGGSLGKTKEDMHQILDWTIPLLPDNRPRHLLGIGAVRDIFEGVERGIDLFDCVIPTREARHRVVYTQKGKISVRKMRTVEEVIDDRPGSPTANDGITFAQLAQWFTERDPRAYYYATQHNIFFFTELMREIRDAVSDDTLSSLKERYRNVY